LIVRRMPAGWITLLFFEITDDMQIRIFTIPLYGGEKQNEEMNVFLRTHKVVDVIHSFAHEQGWSFCVKYVDSSSPGVADNVHGRKNKPDYKELLSEEQFAVFSGLRKARKEIAAADAIPAYAVFTDAELAEFCKMPSLDESSMKKVSGVGAQKVTNYGRRLLDTYMQTISQDAAAEDNAEEGSQLNLM